MSARSTWDRPAPVEVIAPTAQALPGVLAMGVFALSLAGVGVIFHLLFGRKR